MKWTILLLALALLVPMVTSQEQDKVKYNDLTDFEKYVILQKGTERPFTGKYWNHKAEGTYVCAQCDAPLYHSSDKFDSHCGWPSFDDEIEGAVTRVPDADGMRTEIICSNCKGHLGHVFLGEGFTDKNTRHCVNSVSMKFIPASDKQEKLEKAYFAGGCFWGVEYYLQKVEGVKSTSVGYTGGRTDKPTYKDVSYKNTGHAEVVEVEFDTSKVSFEALAKLFFEIHDFTQVNRQGPDIGEQYRTEIFYTSDEQKKVSEKLIGVLEKKGYKVATKVTPLDKYWIAEDYHQDYYQHKGSVPYCHGYRKVFD